MEVFCSLAEAKIVVETWRQSYNNERPDSSLGYQTPAEFAAVWRLESEVQPARSPVQIGAAGSGD
jgi:putative transposase